MLVELNWPETTHKRRLLIGERLDVLGDPRPGVGVDAAGVPKIDWCRVPGGDVTVSILSDPNDPYSEVKDTFRRRIKPFRIARYPTTVTQYRAFITAEDGWCDTQWWEEDDLYRDMDGNTYDFGQFGNHPALYVSWFDAVAFCRWLSHRLRLAVRVPDEWEWQQATTGGGDKNVFPWGADWDAEEEPYRANTFESRLGGATAVGMYPAGASPVGVVDLAGTVWEWCLNKYDKPEVTLSRADDFDPRALRGGSWLYYREFARSAHRAGYRPVSRVNAIGFRVVCPAPASGAGN